MVEYCTHSATGESELRSGEARLLHVANLGTMRYAQALDYQREIARQRIAGELDQDLLLLVQHHPVVTLGRSSKQKNLVSTPEFLNSKGVELFEVERGGDVTFHGPGQLVGYPIIDLTRHKQDLHWYLRAVEEALIKALGSIGIPAGRNTGFTGVWTRGRKIASIGVHARDWVTWHGFALNVTTDLKYFDFIVPCGIDGVVMTSVEKELGSDSPAMCDVETTVADAFGDVFSLTPVLVTAPQATVLSNA